MERGRGIYLPTYCVSPAAQDVILYQCPTLPQGYSPTSGKPSPKFTNYTLDVTEMMRLLMPLADSVRERKIRTLTKSLFTTSYDSNQVSPFYRAGLGNCFYCKTQYNLYPMTSVLHHHNVPHHSLWGVCTSCTAHVNTYLKTKQFVMSRNCLPPSESYTQQTSNVWSVSYTQQTSI